MRDDVGPVRWLLLTGSRRVVVCTLLVGVFSLTVATLAALPPGTELLLPDRGTVSTLLNTLLSGVILLVSIVVSVTSLFVSQELSPLGRQRERIEQTRRFREQTESVLDSEVSPARPGQFLRAVTQAVLMHAQTLDDTVGPAHPGVDEATTGDLQADVDACLELVADDVERVNRTLTAADTGTFDQLLAALEYDYAGQLYAVRRVESRHADRFTDASRAALSDLTDALEFFAAAREYFKSLYFEREFSNLSADLIYVSLPAIVVVSAAVLAVDVRLLGGELFGFPTILLFAAVGYTVGLAPFLVLTSYVLRVATVSRLTLSAGPFIVDEERDPGELF
jgi:hypothetical protein